MNSASDCIAAALSATGSDMPPVLPGIRRLDAYSETWYFVRAHCERRLRELREQNDNPTLSEVRTATLRGQIVMAKEILDLPNPKAFVVPAVIYQGEDDL